MRKALSILLAAVISGFVFAQLTGHAAAPPAVQSTADCQYPNRPLVDGHCDNSDPAVPECIKAADEVACAADSQSHETAPMAAPVTPVKNKCLQ